MKLSEYQDQGHSLALAKDHSDFKVLAKDHSDFKVKTCFPQKQLDDLEPKFM